MLMQNPAQLFAAGDGLGLGLLGMFGAPLAGSTAIPTTDAASAFSALFAQMTQNLGQPLDAADVLDKVAATEGESEATDAALLSIEQTITIIYQELTAVSQSGVNLGDVGSAKELAFAYRQMGMEPEEAARRAVQVTTILAILDQRLQSGAEMGAAVVDPSLLLQVQDMMAQDGGALLKSRSLSIFASIAVTASIDGNLADRILKGENLSQDLGSIVSRTLQALGVSADTDAVGLAEMVEDGSFDAMLQAAVPAKGKGIADALLAFNAGADVPLSDAEMAEVIAAAERLIADARAGGAQKVDAEVIQQLADKQPLNSSKTIAENIAQNAARAAEAAQRIRSDITATIEANPEVAEVMTNTASPTAGSSAERAAPPPASPHAVHGDNNNTAASPLDSKPATDARLAANAQPVMVVESAPDGGYQVVDAKTGEVINIIPHSAPANRAEAAEQLNNMMLQYRASQQVNVHVRTLARHGGGNITVTLTPPELGRLEVSLRIRDGKVEGTITAQKSDVLQHLARDLKGLEQALQDMGLQLGEGGMSLQLAQQDAGNSQESADEAKRHFTRSEIVKANAVDVPAGQGIWLSPDRLMDILV